MRRVLLISYFCEVPSLKETTSKQEAHILIFSLLVLIRLFSPYIYCVSQRDCLLQQFVFIYCFYVSFHD